MSKNVIVVIVSILFLIGSIIYSFSQKSTLGKTVKRVEQESLEVKDIASLQNLWKGKGLKSKIEKIVNSVSKAKRERFNVKRSKVEIKLKGLNDKELNRVLTKLAMLPVEFRKLQLLRKGSEFELECLCVW